MSCRFCAADAGARETLPLVLLLLPELPVALVALVLAALPAVPAALLVVLLAGLAVAAALNAPTAPAVDCVPLSAPPEVLTHTSLSVSGLCQKPGSTSITTWYWFMSLYMVDTWRWPNAS